MRLLRRLPPAARDRVLEIMVVSRRSSSHVVLWWQVGDHHEATRVRGKMAKEEM